MSAGRVPPQFEPLGPHHDRAAFSCGEPALDRYLKMQASQDQRRKLSAVIVLADPATAAIIGFYTLSACQIEPAKLPDDLAHKLPKIPLPATLLGRLAVDRTCQRQGFGELILLDAFARAQRAARDVASYAIVVDAKDARARAFYERHDFQSLLDDERRLFITMQTIGSLGLPF